jgi:hypothetical protein
MVAELQLNRFCNKQIGFVAVQAFLSKQLSRLDTETGLVLIWVVVQQKLM